MNKLEAVIRPRVEGQLRGFIKEHSGILDCVLWFKPNQNRGDVLVNSLAKRIVNELLAEDTVRLIRAALLEDGQVPPSVSGEQSSQAVAKPSAAAPGAPVHDTAQSVDRGTISKQ